MSKTQIRTILHTLLADAMRTKIWVASPMTAHLWCVTLHHLRGEVNRGPEPIVQQLSEEFWNYHHNSQTAD